MNKILFLNKSEILWPENISYSRKNEGDTNTRKKINTVII